jgi:hypothetical protein
LFAYLLLLSRLIFLSCFYFHTPLYHIPNNPFKNQPRSSSRVTAESKHQSSLLDSVMCGIAIHLRATLTTLSPPKTFMRRDQMETSKIL